MSIVDLSFEWEDKEYRHNDGLVYRGEGNANLVVALLDLKKVLRLQKIAAAKVNTVRSEEVFEYDVKWPDPSSYSLTPCTNELDGPNLRDFVDYMQLIRRLIGSEFVCKADIVAFYKEFDRLSILKHISASRPSALRENTILGTYGLILPDVTLLPMQFDEMLSDVQATSKKDIYAIEIKPKQGWLLTLIDSINLFEEELKGIVTPDKTSELSKNCYNCRFCSMQALKLRKGKIRSISEYCPLDLFSGNHDRMMKAINALLANPQNNLRIFKNGYYLYGDSEKSLSYEELAAMLSDDTIMHIKELLVKCLLREYANWTDYIPPKEIKDMALVDDKTYYYLTEERSLDSKLYTITEDTSHLPQNCVLQKILYLQLLAQYNLSHMYKENYANYKTKSYNALTSLLKKKIGNDISLSPEEAYLLGATTLDCSILVAFTEINMPSNSSSNFDTLLPWLVELPDFRKSYMTKVSLIDLDPKPDNHFHKYIQNTKDTLNCSI